MPPMPPFRIHILVYLLCRKLVGMHHSRTGLEDPFLCCGELGLLIPAFGCQAWLALVWANWASACDLRRVDMRAAMSRPPGTAPGAGSVGVGICGGVLGLLCPQLSPLG